MSTKNKSQQLINEIRSKIISGEFPEGYRFETMPKLAQTMHTTVATLDKVFSALQNADLIERINGRGIFVRQKKSKHYILIFDSNAECGTYGHKSFFVKYFREECKKRNIKVSLLENIDNVEDCLYVRKFLTNNPCDAIGLASQVFADNIQKYMNGFSIPVTGLYRYAGIENSITYDRSWLINANTVLRQNGCNSVAVISGETMTVPWEDDLPYSCRALKDNITSAEDIYRCRWQPRDGYEATIKYLEKNPKLPCGIICTDSILTLGVISAVFQKGLKIMEDVILISHANQGSLLAEFPAPVLKIVCNIPDQVQKFLEFAEKPSGHISIPVTSNDSEVRGFLNKSKTQVRFPVGHIDNIPYFMPPVNFNETAERLNIISVNKKNTTYAESVSPIEDMKISGSFIYAQPPDYKGTPMLNASAGEWRKVFQRFKKMHMECVIFQAALWQELNRCFYMSEYFTSMTRYTVLENMLTAAEEENIHVFLGGYGSCSGWQKNFDKQSFEKELELQKKCFEEISSIGKIDGMYFPSETAFSGIRDKMQEKHIRNLYKHFSDMVKNADSTYKVLISPATAPFEGKENIFIDFWNSILAGSNIDIVMPQDSVGNGNLLEISKNYWQYWKQCTDMQNMELWANIELFERQGFNPASDIIPAPPVRIAAQITNAAPFVSRIVCWEALHLTSDNAGEKGKILRNFLEK